MSIRDKVYTLTEAANLLRVNRITLHRWIQKGRLKGEKIGRVVLIDREAVDRLLEERR